MIITVSRFYSVVTPESAEQGDYADSGEVYTDREMTVKETIEEIRSGGFVEPSSSHVHAGIWISTVDPDRNYQDGSETYETIHFKRGDGADLSTHQSRRLLRAAKVNVRD